jgi:hypothetical protein
MTTRHKLRACLSHGPKDIGAEVDVELAFTFLAGSPASQEDSGWPGELEFIDAAPLRPFDGAFADLERKWLTELAEEWFWSDEGQAAAMEEVLAELQEARVFIAALRRES